MERVDDVPVVSVIMPAYNCSAYLEEAIRSVIAQTFTAWELIVIDDCSTDDTYAVAAAMARTDSRIRLLQNPCNAGVAVTRNTGLELCRGQYIAFLDSDDFWYPDKLQVQLDRMQRENAQFCYSAYAIVDIHGQKVKADYPVPAKVTYRQLLKENVIQCSAVLVSAQLAKKYRFDPGYYHEDYVLWLQMLRDGCKATGCQQILLTWRYVKSSRSFNKLNSAKNRWRIYRKYLKLPLGESIYCFMCYAAAGMRKYCSKAK